MSLRPKGRVSTARLEDAPVTAVRATEALVVTGLDLDDEISPRAVLDAVVNVPAVIVARQRAAGDLDRLARVRWAVSGLSSRTYAASSVALERSRFPF